MAQWQNKNLSLKISLFIDKIVLMEYYLLWNDKTLGINSLSVHYFHQSRVFDRFAELQQNSNSSSSVYTCNYILTVGHDGFTNIGHARGHSKMTGYRYIITGTVLVCLRYMKLLTGTRLAIIKYMYRISRNFAMT